MDGADAKESASSCSGAGALAGFLDDLAACSLAGFLAGLSAWAAWAAILFNLSPWAMSLSWSMARSLPRMRSISALIQPLAVST